MRVVLSFTFDTLGGVMEDMEPAVYWSLVVYNKVSEAAVTMGIWKSVFMPAIPGATELTWGGALTLVVTMSVWMNVWVSLEDSNLPKEVKKLKSVNEARQRVGDQIAYALLLAVVHTVRVLMSGLLT